jgi:hypothetical protein
MSKMNKIESCTICNLDERIQAKEKYLLPNLVPSEEEKLISFISAFLNKFSLINARRAEFRGLCPAGQLTR